MRRPGGSVLWRLVGLGFVQLVVLGVAVFWVGYLLRPGPPPHGHPGPSSGVVMSEPEPPPGAPGPPPGRPRHDDHGPVPLAPLVTFLLAGLVIVGTGSVVMARSIVAPLALLSRTARALGAGDLSARTGMTGRDEIGEVGQAFDDMAARLQRLLAAEREMLANVSHELRTPLARVRVALDLASEAAGSDRPSVAEIQLDLSEIESLIDDILTATRLDLEAGRGSAAGFPLHLQLTAPAALCARAAERFRARHASRPLEVQAAAELPAVEVDPSLLRRALDNLLENAHKYSPDPTTPIALRATSSGHGVVIEISDRGAGIALEDQPHVMTPFFRGERSRSRAAGGVGLGLTLARRIVEAHGGVLDLTSAPGVGTTVRVALPAGAASPAPSAPSVRV